MKRMFANLKKEIFKKRHPKVGQDEEEEPVEEDSGPANNPNDLEFDLGDYDIHAIGEYLVWASEGAELARLLGTGTLPMDLEGIAAWLEFAPAIAVTSQELIEEYFEDSGMGGFLDDEQFRILFNFVMEEHATSYLD